LLVNAGHDEMMEEIGGCDAVVKKRGKHVDCSLFESTPGAIEGNAMGGDCINRRTILAAALRAAILTIYHDL
jgi:hypothetical protein